MRRRSGDPEMRRVVRHGRGAGRAVPADERPRSAACWRSSSLAAVVVVGAVDVGAGFPLPVLAAALVMAVLVWAAMLRPRRVGHHRGAGAAQHADHRVHPARRDRAGRGAPGHGGQRRREALRVGRDRQASAQVLGLGSPRRRRRTLRLGPRPAAGAADRGPRRRPAPRPAVRRLRRGPDQPPRRGAPAPGAASRGTPRSSWRWPRRCAARSAWPEIVALAVACALFVGSLVV